MTPAQRESVRQVLQNTMNSGLAYGYQKQAKEPAYTVAQALKDIETILEGE